MNADFISFFFKTNDINYFYALSIYNYNAWSVSIDKQ